MAWLNRNLRNKVALIVPASFCIAGEALAFNLRISFSIVSGIAPVPLSPWAMAGLSALVALLAGLVLRRRPFVSHSRLLLLPATLLLATIVIASSVTNANANFGDVTTVNLVSPSPMSSPEVAFEQDISIINATGQAIRLDLIEIRGWTIVPPRFEQPSQSPRCLPGLVVPATAACYVKIGYGPQAPD